MVLNICDHCNLRCKGCDHFACIADPYFVPFDTIYHALKRLSELFHNDYIMKMSVMGGEPLLHPDLLKILETEGIRLIWILPQGQNISAGTALEERRILTGKEVNLILVNGWKKMRIEKIYDSVRRRLS